MPEFQFTHSLIRQLRPTAFTVLVALMLFEREGQVPVTADMLKIGTGLRDHSITDALQVLTDPTYQIVVRAFKGWRLAEGFQFPLEFGQGVSDTKVFREKREKLSPSTCSSSSSLLINLTRDEEEQEKENREKRDFSQSDSDGPNSAEQSLHVSDEQFRSNWEAAAEVGIMEPMRSRVAGHKRVTPEVIRGHVAHAKADQRPLGTAIYRILHDWYHVLDEPLPGATAADVTAEITGHQVGCKCGDCELVRMGYQWCPDCKHALQNCTCPDEEDDDSANA